MLKAQADSQLQHFFPYFRSFDRLGCRATIATELDRAIGSSIDALARGFDLGTAVLFRRAEPEDRFTPIAFFGVEAEAVGPVRVGSKTLALLQQKARICPPRGLPVDFAGLLARKVGGWFWQEGAALVPLLAGGEVVGLFVFDRPGEEPLSGSELDLLWSMSQNIGVYLYNRQVHARCEKAREDLERAREECRQIYRQAVLSFLTAIDIKDGYTKEHSLRVARMAVEIAREIGIPEPKIEGIYFAGLLHDIGKILVDKHILNKPGSLDLTEYAEMSQHTRLGAEILSHIRFPWDQVLHTIRHHHDTPACQAFAKALQNGTGLATRIIGLVDAFDAMTTDRPYRKARTVRDSIAEIVDCLNTQFDPEIARVFLHMIERDIDAPAGERRLLGNREIAEDIERLHTAIQRALNHVEQYIDVVTAY
jgi:putative nucleotidyltransferase with HDIG domain